MMSQARPVLIVCFDCSPLRISSRLFQYRLRRHEHHHYCNRDSIRANNCMLPSLLYTSDLLPKVTTKPGKNVNVTETVKNIKYVTATVTATLLLQIVVSCH